MKRLSILLFLPATSATLPHDLAAKIPPCAQKCVQSFLNVNYNEAKQASLKELCLRNGASGFTLGEGAMQCLMALGQSGHCSDRDSSREAIYGAYSICNNFQGAVRPTHGVITATLAVAPTGGEMTFPPIQSDASSTVFSQTTTSDDVLSTAESTTTLTTSTPTPTSTTPASATTHSNRLSTKKITGIVLGSLSGLAVLVALVFFARRFISSRRERKSDMGSLKDSGSRSSSSATAAPHHPIYEEMKTVTPPRPNVYDRSSFTSSAIGCALPTPARTSPGLAPPASQQKPPESRPVSRLLPDRPSLPPAPGPDTPPPQAMTSSPTIRTVPFEPPTLTVQSATPTTIHTSPTPPRPHTPPAIIASPPPMRSPNHPGPPLQLRTPKHANFNASALGPPQKLADRMSVATEFEEDGQESAVGVRSPLTPAGETFCLPSAGGLNSAYVSDGHGNWRTKESHVASPSYKNKVATQRPQLTETHTSSSEALPREHRQSIESASSSQFHRATEALALSNSTMSSAIPPTPKLPHESVRLSQATMPSPLHIPKHASPRSVSQPTLQHVPIPRPKQTPRSFSANQRQSQAASQQQFSPIAESSHRPALRQNQPNFAVQPPAHHHYNPAIPHSSDDRASLPSRTRYQPPPSSIQHNFPQNPRPRAGPGGNPEGRPYPGSRYPAMPQQQRPTTQRPQNHCLYPSSGLQQRQLLPHEHQRQPHSPEVPYPEDPQALWEKRQGVKASQLSINTPAGPGDSRWRRQGPDSKSIDWMDQ